MLGERPDFIHKQPSQPEQTQPMQGRAEGKQSFQGSTTVDDSGQPQQPSPEAGHGSHALPITPQEQPPFQPESLEGNPSAPPVDQIQNDLQLPQTERKRRKPVSSETREKIGAVHRGKTLSPETRQKISETHKGKTLSPETREKIGKSQVKSAYIRAEKRYAEWKMQESEKQKAEAEETARLIFSIGKTPIN